MVIPAPLTFPLKIFCVCVNSPVTVNNAPQNMYNTYNPQPQYNISHPMEIPNYPQRAYTRVNYRNPNDWEAYTSGPTRYYEDYQQTEPRFTEI